MQTRTAKGEGNCLAACVASILEVDGGDLPTFDGAGWWDRFVNWMHHWDVYPLRTDGADWTPQGWSIASGPSPRFGGLHAVVAYHGQVAHDPHPSGDGLAGEIEDFIILVPFDPAKAVRR